MKKNNVSYPNWRKMIVESKLPTSLEPLKEISRNLWWVWNNEAGELFESMDADLWEACNNNPVKLIEELPLETLLKLEQDKVFISKMNTVKANLDKYLQDREKPVGPKIAYFSMEFGLHSSLKIYSGGLGVLAGDYIKEASDSSSNLVGVGLLYRFGYFTQVISPSGEQIASYEPEEFAKLPIAPVMKDGEWITVSVQMPGRDVFMRVWEVKVGAVTLYLLDTDLDANNAEDRAITHHLYGGDNENRIKQEMVLGLGGIRALRAIGQESEIYHCNEGHAAFITLERCKDYITKGGLSFDVAKEVISRSTLFTTHTPVPAGHDSFHIDLFGHYMGKYASKLNLSWEDFINLGKADPSEDHFNMSYLAATLSQEINGVSMLHGDVSKDLLAPLYPGYLPEELENIGYVTNGIHYPTWTSKSWKSLHNKMLNREFPISVLDYNIEEEAAHWNNVFNINDDEIWNTKQNHKKQMFEFIEHKFKNAYIKKNENPKYVSDVLKTIDKDALTICFARRFATYKRAHLLFRDLDRLSKILNNPNKPVQFIFAGKAHPADKGGQGLIKFISDIAKRPEFLGKILFIPNYDMTVATKLVQGGDIWMNTPTRPLEASGTSGEKGIMNGTLHFSVLDGWWVEGYKQDAGWCLPLERTYDNQDLQDELDAETIYNLLENEIVPSYYYRDEFGTPRRWVNYIKNSFSKVSPHFTMTRMLKDYYDRFYLPIHARREKFIADDFKLAKETSAWKAKVASVWDNITVISKNVNDGVSNSYAAGEKYPTDIVLNLKSLSTEDVGVELVIATNTETPKLVNKYEFKGEMNADGTATYKLDINLTVPGVYNCGIRLFPKNEQLAHRLEFKTTTWI